MNDSLKCATRIEAMQKAKARLATYLLEVQITFSLSQEETLAVLSKIIISETVNKDIQ
jgi:hypothetical protein